MKGRIKRFLKNRKNIKPQKAQKEDLYESWFILTTR